LFTPKLDVANLKLFIPPNPNVEDPNLQSDEEITEEESEEDDIVVSPEPESTEKPSTEQGGELSNSDQSQQSQQQPQPSLGLPQVSHSTKVAVDKNAKRTSIPAVLHKPEIMHKSPHPHHPHNKLFAREDKAKKRRSKNKKPSKLWSHSTGNEEDGVPEENVDALVTQFHNQEKVYLDSIRLLIQEFKQPLQTENVISNDDYVQLFSHVEEILSLHESFQNLNDPDKIFTTLLAQSVTYSNYISNQSSSKITLSRLIQENPKFTEFLTARSNKNLELSSLLDTPIIRLLDLEQILKKFIQAYTDDEQHLNLVEKLEEVVSDLAVQIRKQQQVTPHLIELSRHVEKIPESVPFLIPARQHISQFEMAVRFPDDKKRQLALHVVLLTDMLFIYSSIRKTFRTKSKDTCEAVLVLLNANCSDELVVDPETKLQSVKFTTGDGKIFFFSELADHKKFISSVQHAIKSIPNHKQFLKETIITSLLSSIPKKLKRKSFAGTTKHQLVSTKKESTKLESPVIPHKHTAPHKSGTQGLVIAKNRTPSKPTLATSDDNEFNPDEESSPNIRRQYPLKANNLKSTASESFANIQEVDTVREYGETNELNHIHSKSLVHIAIKVSVEEGNESKTERTHTRNIQDSPTSHREDETESENHDTNREELTDRTDDTTKEPLDDSSLSASDNNDTLSISDGVVINNDEKEIDTKNI